MKLWANVRPGRIRIHIHTHHIHIQMHIVLCFEYTYCTLFPVLLVHKCRVTWNSRKTNPGTWTSWTQSRWWLFQVQGPSVCRPSPTQNQRPRCRTSLHWRNFQVLQPVGLELPWRLPRHLPKIWHPVTIPPPWLWELWQCTRELFVTRALAAQSCLWWSLWDLSMSLKCIALLVWKRLMLAVISHPTGLFAEQGTKNMSRTHTCMPHCSNHWQFSGFLPSRRAQANAFAFTTFWLDPCHGRPRCGLHHWGRFGKTS